jgi:hypothetical protein
MVSHINDLQYSSYMSSSRLKCVKYVAYFDFVKFSLLRCINHIDKHSIYWHVHIYIMYYLAGRAHYLINNRSNLAPRQSIYTERRN